jgi:hypothetical protein
MTDSLSMLQRLRRLQTSQAARFLTATLATEQEALRSEQDIKSTRRREAQASPAEAPGAYASWLPVSQAALQAAAGAAQAAAADVHAARTSLAEARAAERSVAHVAEDRKTKAHRKAQRKAENP